MTDFPPVVSTYRLQLRGDAFTFADAVELLDYLDDLGVSHLYLSPILTAASGSTHGYDVTDPTTVSSCLGGRDGLARLSAAARARGMGLIVDIVPNHLGVAAPQQNPWWWDVLTFGPDSAYARFFDIDWSADNGVGGKLALPVLGSDDDIAGVTVDGDVLRLGDLAFPIAPGTGVGSGPGTGVGSGPGTGVGSGPGTGVGSGPGAGVGSGPVVHDRQHYRLIGWRSGLSGYRRFFAITSLAGLRQEDRAVFDASHAEVRRWFTEGLVDGVRVDHPDGLSDPPGYLRWLRELAGPSAWIVIEKILAVDEALDLTLPVAGTTGYDALREVGGVFLDPAGEAALTALFSSTGVPYESMPLVARQLKAATVVEMLAGELRRVCRTVSAAAGADHRQLPEAVAALISHIGVYRCDYPTLAAVLGIALADTASEATELCEPLQIVAAALARDDGGGDDGGGDDGGGDDGGGRESAVRVQQLCGAATAKSMEDCLFYRDARLVSLNEVGGDPARFGVSAAEFHQRAGVRARMWPRAMTTLSTHDTKRGEDVRARIGVLSQVPALWAQLVGGWEQRAPSPDPVTGLFLWQNIFGVWPADGAVTQELRDRLHAYAEKAIREAGTHTSWNDPDASFETAVHSWIDTVICGDIAAELTGLVAQLDPHGRSDALGQKLLQLTAPGVPDVYQGTELWEDSLVDPDNRRPVDWGSRRAALAALTHPKMRVTATALRLRRARSADFLSGSYTPALASGSGRSHLVAFFRGDDVLVAVSRWTVRLAETGWGDTVLALPSGVWTDTLTSRRWTDGVEAAELFAELPVALLERFDG